MRSVKWGSPDGGPGLGALAGVAVALVLVAWVALVLLGLVQQAGR